LGGKTQGGWGDSTVKGKRRAVLRVKPEASLTGKIPAHRTHLKMQNLLGTEYEGARLLFARPANFSQSTISAAGTSM